MNAIKKERVRCTSCGRRVTVYNGKTVPFVCSDCALKEARKREEERARARTSTAHLRFWWTED